MKVELDLPDKYKDAFVFDGFDEFFHHIKDCVNKVSNDFTRKALLERTEMLSEAFRAASYAYTHTEEFIEEETQAVNDAIGQSEKKKTLPVDSVFEPDGEFAFHDLSARPKHGGR